MTNTTGPFIPSHANAEARNQRILDIVTSGLGYGRLDYGNLPDAESSEDARVTACYLRELADELHPTS